MDEEIGVTGVAPFETVKTMEWTTVELEALHQKMTGFKRWNLRTQVEEKRKTMELSALHAENAAATGRIQQLEFEAVKFNTELATERQTSETARISLAKSELRMEAVPKIEIEIEKLRMEIEVLKIKAAQSHESEMVALTKMEVEHQSAQETREAAIKSRDATEALREKYEHLLADALNIERATAKLLENERLTSQSLQLTLEDSIHELATANNNVLEQRAAAQKSL